MKRCKACNCNYPVMSDGYCSKHRPKCKEQSCFKYTRDGDWCKEHNKKVKAAGYGYFYLCSDLPGHENYIIHNPIVKSNETQLAKNQMKKPKLPKHVISKLSKKGIAKGRKIQSIKNKLIEQNGNTCFFTGYTKGRLDAFHIFPKGKFPEYATEEWNIILSTRAMNRTWDQGTWDEILKMPNIHWLLRFIQTKDNDPNKKHIGSFYEQLIERKNK